MNRRKFFKSFGAIIAAVAVAQKCVADAALKVIEEASISAGLKVNLAWVNAPYEVAYIMSEKAWDSLKIKSIDDLPEGVERVFEEFPVRMDEDQKVVPTFL